MKEWQTNVTQLNQNATVTINKLCIKSFMQIKTKNKATKVQCVCVCWWRRMFECCLKSVYLNVHRMVFDCLWMAGYLRTVLILSKAKAFDTFSQSTDLFWRKNQSKAVDVWVFKKTSSQSQLCLVSWMVGLRI